MPYGIKFRGRGRIAIAHIGIARVNTSRDAIGIFDGDIAAGGRGGIRNVGGIAIQRGSLVSGGDDLPYIPWPLRVEVIIIRRKSVILLAPQTDARAMSKSK
jgi:stage V sporulation protein SpoVS